jgi:hypothetical protein
MYVQMNVTWREEEGVGWVFLFLKQLVVGNWKQQVNEVPQQGVPVSGAAGGGELKTAS